MLLCVTYETRETIKSKSVKQKENHKQSKFRVEIGRE